MRSAIALVGELGEIDLPLDHPQPGVVGPEPNGPGVLPMKLHGGASRGISTSIRYKSDRRRRAVVGADADAHERRLGLDAAEDQRRPFIMDFHHHGLADACSLLQDAQAQDAVVVDLGAEERHPAVDAALDLQFQRSRRPGGGRRPGRKLHRFRETAVRHVGGQRDADPVAAAGLKRIEFLGRRPFDPPGHPSPRHAARQPARIGPRFASRSGSGPNVSLPRGKSDEPMASVIGDGAAARRQRTVASILNRRLGLGRVVAEHGHALRQPAGLQGIVRARRR